MNKIANTCKNKKRARDSTTTQNEPFPSRETLGLSHTHEDLLLIAPVSAAYENAAPLLLSMSIQVQQKKQ